MSIRICVTLIAVCLFAGRTTAQNERAYVTDSSGNLSVLNLWTGEYVVLGNLSAQITTQIVALAHNAETGTLYCLNEGAVLFEIDPETITATEIGSTGLIGQNGIVGVNAMDMDDGRLVCITRGNVAPSAYQLSTEDATPTFLVTATTGSSSTDSMTFVSADQVLYVASGTLLSLNLSSGATELRGLTGPASLYSIGYSRGRVLGLDPILGVVNQVDTFSGVTTALTSYFDVLYQPSMAVFLDEGCTADLNEDESVDFFDVQAFLEAFQAGCP